MPRIPFTSVYVDDQDRALRFYTELLGFEVARDLPIGDYRWLTLRSPEQPGGVELLLEPDAHPAAKAFKTALVADGVPFTSFAVDDVVEVFEDLVARGVRFVQPPTALGTVMTVVLDDTCGNLIQLTAPAPNGSPS